MQATASSLLGAALLNPGHSTPAAAPPQPPPPPTATALTDHTHISITPPPGSAQNRTGQQQAGEWSGVQARGVSLPAGQWITPVLAAAVASAATAVWQRRRAQYRPRPPAAGPRSDPDLAPLPDLVTMIQDRLQPPPDLYDQDQPHPTQPPTAVVEGWGLPAGGVGLTGPGAHAAARALIATALLPTPRHAGAGLVGGPDRTAAGDGVSIGNVGMAGHVRLVTTAADLKTLLPGTPTPTCPGLHTAGNLTAALALAETVALSRAAKNGDPATLLLVGPPATAGDSQRLRVLAALASPLAVTTVILGAWPHGPTWHVDTDGTHHPSTPPSTTGAAADRNAGPGTSTGAPPRPAVNGVGRISVLGVTATVDLLSLSPPLLPDPVGSRFDAAIARSGTLTLARLPVPRPAPTAHPADLPPVAWAGRASARLVLRVLGLPNVYPAGSDTPLRLPRSAGLRLLVYLVLHPDGATTGDLGRALWPDPAVPATAHRVHSTVSALRGVLDRAARGPVIVRHTDRYLLDRGHLDVDLWHLHDLNHAVASAPDPYSRARALRAVVAACPRPLAEGWGWSWLDPHREATRRLVDDARTALADHEPDPATRHSPPRGDQPT
jgi:hypothetical protein